MGKHRLPMLDEAVEGLNEPLFDKFPKKHVRDAVTRASRFVFDDDASRYLGRFVGSCSDLIVQNRQFALPPTDPCYVEFDLQLMYEAAGRSVQVQNLPDASVDKRVGYLISGGRVYECAGSDDDAFFSPLSMEFGVPAQMELLFEEAAHREYLFRAGLILGSGLHHLDDEDELARIVMSTRIRSYFPDSVRKKLALTVQFINGFGRNAWAALLLLNQQKGVRTTSIGPRAAIVGGKRRVFSRHKIISIDLCPEKDMRKRILNGRRASPVGHAVRGHFMHFNLRPGCEHVWPVMSDDDDRWVCRSCGGVRRWRNQFVRGDTSKGFVTHDYAIGASQS